MGLELHEFFLKYPTENKLIGDDYLFIEYKCPLESEKAKMWTDTPFLVYVVSGKKDWTSIDKTHTIEAGEALFFKRGLYSTKQYFDEAYCTVVFFITEDFIRKFMSNNETIFKLKNNTPTETHIYNVDATDSLKTLFLSIFNYLKLGCKIPRDLVEMKFNELFFNLAMNPTNKDLLTYFTSLKHVEKVNIENVMNKNFYFDLKLEEFARLCGRSLSTFKRDFQNYFNETPGKWLNTKRLEYAKVLLENPELNISDVCYESGFKNISHFNSSFKNRFNYPPYKYRKLILKY